MEKFIVWADGRKGEAKVIEAGSMPEAIEQAAADFDVTEDKVNIIDATRAGEAEYYGVGDLAI